MICFDGIVILEMLGG